MGRGEERSHPPGHLLPQAGPRRDQREHPGDLAGGLLPGTRPRVAFGKGEEEAICLGSADDLMQRNLDRRVEQLFPLRDARRRDRVRRLLKLQLAHTVNAWELKPDGSCVRLQQRGDEEPLDSQALLFEEGF